MAFKTTHARRLAGPALMLVMIGFAGCGSLGSKPPDDAFDDGNKTWQEVAVNLPAMPQPANLLPFDVSAITTQRFAVDEKSLTLGADGVVRYTLVGVSPSGVKNVSYEGIRCESREQKIYALGHDDGTWSQARRSEWQPILSNAVNRQQAALAQDYFCAGRTIVGNASDMVRRLRRHDTITSDLTR
ncbi:MAG: CNP1-like family protein [Pseudomonadota bacterium]|nr:CNP1-like family protein [Pseudomonadota bacterium]